MAEWVPYRGERLVFVGGQASPAQPDKVLPLRKPCECDAECFEFGTVCFCGCHIVAALSHKNPRIS